MQFANAYSPRDATPSGMEMEFNFSQPLKTPLPIEVTDLGIITESKLLQDEKAPSPMTVILSGMMTELNFSQLPNVPLSRDVSVDGIVTERRLVQS